MIKFKSHKTKEPDVNEDVQLASEPPTWADRHPVLDVLRFFGIILAIIIPIVFMLFSTTPSAPEPNTDPRDGEVLYGVVGGDEIYIECMGPDLVWSTHHDYLGDTSGPYQTDKNSPLCD